VPVVVVLMVLMVVVLVLVLVVLVVEETHRLRALAEYLHTKRAIV